MPKLPIGPIIGGALGALTFICGILLLLYLRRRRREGHSDKDIGAPPLAIGRPPISPYDISQHPQHADRGKPFVGTRTETAGMAATQVITSSSAAGTVHRTAPPAAATTSYTLGGMIDPSRIPPPAYRPR